MAEHTIFPSIAPSSDSDTDPAEAFARGACPFCQKTDFDRPKSHARNAHPNEYDAWSEG